MPQRWLSIKNFDKYQTFTKQNPPWFKIHKTLFGDREFTKLCPKSRFLYIGLIYLAVESQNKVYNDRTWIAQRLYIPCTDVDLKPLYRAGFLLNSNVRRTLSEADSSEAELTETELAEADTDRRVAPKPQLSRREKLECFSLEESDREWAKAQLNIPNADEYVPEFKDYWRGIEDKKLKSDWQATFRNRLRYLKDKNQLKESVWT